MNRYFAMALESIKRTGWNLIPYWYWVRERGDDQPGDFHPVTEPIQKLRCLPLRTVESHQEGLGGSHNVQGSWRFQWQIPYKQGYGDIHIQTLL